MAQLKQDFGVSFKPWIARLEAILETIEMSGPVRDEVKRALLELSQVRNVLVYRKGLADSKLINLCPWLALKPGDSVRVSQAQFRDYSMAGHWYLVELDVRKCIRLKYDDSRIEFRRKMQNRILELISRVGRRTDESH